MAMTLGELARNALALPHSERAILADRIVESLDLDMPPDLEQEQLAEVRKRIVEIESGAVQIFPIEDVLEEGRRLLSEQPDKI